MSETGAPGRARRAAQPAASAGEEAENENSTTNSAPRRNRARRERDTRVLASNPLRNITTIIRKELQGYFNSTIAYFVIAAFLVLNGYLFWVILVQSKTADMGP